MPSTGVTEPHNIGCGASETLHRSVCGFQTNKNTEKTVRYQATREDDDDEVLLNVLRCQLTYQGQVVTNAEARCNNSLRPRKPEGSLGRTNQDGHLDSHTAPEL